MIDTMSVIQDELGEVCSNFKDMVTVSVLTETKEELKERAEKQEKEIESLKADL